MYCIRLDIHETTISYCVKDGSGAVRYENTIRVVLTGLTGRDNTSAQTAGNSPSG
jgi:hypothetical protein